MSSIEERLSAVEARLQAAEDHLAIMQIISQYGPLVDSADTPEKCIEAAQLWGADGAYDLSFMGTYRGPQLADLFAADLHQSLAKDGCAHMSTLPHIHIEGDRAAALGYLHVTRKEEGVYKLFAVAADYWLFKREHGHWKIDYRSVRGLDGSEDGKRLLEHIKDTNLEDSSSDQKSRNFQ